MVKKMDGYLLATLCRCHDNLKLEPAGRIKTYTTYTIPTLKDPTVRDHPNIFLYSGDLKSSKKMIILRSHSVFGIISREELKKSGANLGKTAKTKKETYLKQRCSKFYMQNAQ